MWYLFKSLWEEAGGGQVRTMRCDIICDASAHNPCQKKEEEELITVTNRNLAGQEMNKDIKNS